MIWQLVPWYVIVPVAVFLAAGLLNLYAAVRRAIAVQGIKKLALMDVAESCLKVEQRFYEFTEARQQEVSEITSIARPPDGTDWNEWYDKRSVHEQEFMHRLKAKIGADIGAAIARLAVLDINAESDLRSIQWADGTARYFGAVGRLLKDGHLDAARKLDKRTMHY